MSLEHFLLGLLENSFAAFIPVDLTGSETARKGLRFPHHEGLGLLPDEAHLRLHSGEHRQPGVHVRMRRPIDRLPAMRSRRDEAIGSGPVALGTPKKKKKWRESETSSAANFL